MSTCIDETINTITGKIAWLQDIIKGLQRLKVEFPNSTTPAPRPPTSLAETVRRETRRITSEIETAVKAPCGTKPARGDLSPLSPRMIAFGRGLAEPFGARELRRVSGADAKQVWNALGRWGEKGWITKQERGAYVRTEGFGLDVQTGEVAGQKQPEPEPPPAGSAAKPVPAVASADPAHRILPFDSKAIELAGSLKTTFTVEELAGLCPMGKQQAYYWVSQWRGRNWIEKTDFDVYRKTKTFGK